MESQAAAQTKAVADARIALDKATEERADDEKKLASVRQTLTELRKTAQERDAQIARLRELIAREESAVQLATSRAKDYASQRDSLTSQRDDARQQLDALRSEADSIADDDGAALDAARATLAECRERLNERADKQREIQSKIISLKAKADALADTLDSRNASGSLERDTDVASLGRLTDFIHVAEGWEDAVAHALDQYASAIVVPAVGNMLHALERAREDKLGKAVVLTASIAGDSATEPGTESEESSAENAGAAPRSGNALAALVTANPDAENPAQAEAVVRTVRLLLADVAAAGTADEAQQIVAFGEAMRAVSKNGETFTHGVAAVGGSSISQSDLSLAARRDKALAQVKQLTAQDGGMAEQVAEAKAKRDEAARLVDQESAKRTEARLKAQQAEKSLKSATDRVASFTRQLDQLDRKITETQENCNEHQLKLDDLNRALASARQSTAEHADFDELDERERTLERGLNLTREHEVAAKIAWTEASRKGESLSRQAGLLRDNAKEAAERRARIEALNDRRREQAAHLQGVADDARAVAAMVEHTLHDVAAKRDELQAAASSHDEELKALRAQRNQIEPKVTDLAGREHALDVNRERLAAESGQLMQKVSDELGLTLEELVSDYGPEQPVPVLDDEGNPVPLDETEAEAGTEEGETGGEAGTNGDSARFKTVPYNRQEQKKRLDKARRELAALGKINPLATEEFEALEERNKYLNDQRNDVVKSRDDLMQLIKDLDSTMVQVFKSAFDDTAEAFEQMFATLFPGGTGRLRLENPEDMLTTGVLVEASPAGKRVKQLSLLSGGERSLTALALLFAIFTARPSPFYVMDEVEAALDDVNLTRLINAFNELRAHAQLIIITHQQRTMSIADALYGVTMRADGVTAVVSQKLER
ncbi:chromosome partitioning protein Smc [Bifidobacterium longum subsp. longum]|nr:chromosome partitioning protein Smc [Bifidobacterium longum subsp. longum]